MQKLFQTKQVCPTWSSCTYLTFLLFKHGLVFYCNYQVCNTKEESSYHVHKSKYSHQNNFFPLFFWNFEFWNLIILLQISVCMPQAGLNWILNAIWPLKILFKLYNQRILAFTWCKLQDLTEFPDFCYCFSPKWRKFLISVRNNCFPLLTVLKINFFRFLLEPWRWSEM